MSILTFTLLLHESQESESRFLYFLEKPEFQENPETGS